MRSSGLLLILLTTSFVFGGCAENEQDAIPNKTVHAELETGQGPQLAAPAIYRGDDFNRTLDQCAFVHNSDEVISGEITSVGQVYATDCKPESLRAPYKVVEIDTATGPRTLHFAEYHYPHRELVPGRKLHVGVRQLDENQFGMNYVFEVTPQDSDQLEYRPRASVDLTLTTIASLRTAISGNGCPDGMSNEQFRRYVTNKVEACDEPAPNERQYGYNDE